MKNRYAIKKGLINTERSARGAIMKKTLSALLLLCFTGCASIAVPNYIQDKNPYKRVFYAPFDHAREVTIQTLEESGWVVERESKPALFERERDLESGNKQTLIFTEVRQTSFFIGSRYAKINAYVYETASNETEVEIRYVTVTSLMFKNFYGYKHDKAVEHIFRNIEKNLSF